MSEYIHYWHTNDSGFVYEVSEGTIVTLTLKARVELETCNG